MLTKDVNNCPQCSNSCVMTEQLSLAGSSGDCSGNHCCSKCSHLQQAAHGDDQFTSVCVDNLSELQYLAAIIVASCSIKYTFFFFSRRRFGSIFSLLQNQNKAVRDNQMHFQLHLLIVHSIVARVSPFFFFSFKDLDLCRNITHG